LRLDPCGGWFCAAADETRELMTEGYPL
jgi:hypothetical protein